MTHLLGYHILYQYKQGMAEKRLADPLQGFCERWADKCLIVPIILLQLFNFSLNMFMEIEMPV